MISKYSQIKSQMPTTKEKDEVNLNLYSEYGKWWQFLQKKCLINSSCCIKIYRLERWTQKNLNQVKYDSFYSIPYQITITLLTIYSLFGDDIRTVGFYKKDDLAFDGINIALMVIFGLEIVLSSLAIENYFMSFFFFLDFISSFSLLFDISIFNEIIYLSSYTNNYTYSKMATQSKATRAAIRAIRVVKLFRIIRIVKIYKSALKAE